MGFKKAKPAQSKLRIALYGPPGSGKTFSSLLIAEGLAAKEGKRIAYVDTEESGTDFYAVHVPSREAHPEAFDFDVLRTQSLAETVQAVQQLNPEDHGVIVVDSITHLWEAAMNAGEQTSKGTVKFGEWAKVKRPYKRLVKWLMESPFHVIVCGRQKNVFEDDEKGDTKKTGVTMNAERDTAYEPQVCIRLEAKVKKDDTTVSTYYAYAEKDRTGILAGRTLANLKYEHFAPMLELLGGEQVKLPDTDDVAIQDAALMEQEDEAVKEKRQKKSSELLARYSKKIEEAGDLASLAAIGEELKTKRGTMLDAHREVLGDQFKQRAVELRKD